MLRTAFPTVALIVTDCDGPCRSLDARFSDVKLTFHLFESIFANEQTCPDMSGAHFT
jgi:hypothetical protein